MSWLTSSSCRCGQLEQACERVKGGWAKSCLACGRVKQRCMGSVWEGGDGLNRMPMGELTGLVRELVGEMRGFREELREVKKVVEKGLRNMAKASHLWHRTPVADVLDYTEWWVGFPQEEIEEEYQELWREDLTYWEYQQVDKEKLDELVTTRFKDYELEEGKEERGDGLEEWVPEVDLEE